MKLKEKSKLPENLFRLLYINSLFGTLLFMMILGLFSFFGLFPVNFNDEQVYGIKGLLVLVLFTPFTTLLFVTLMWIGLKLGNLVINILFRN
jgi:hypothetical protein